MGATCENKWATLRSRPTGPNLNLTSNSDAHIGGRTCRSEPPAASRLYVRDTQDPTGRSRRYSLCDNRSMFSPPLLGCGGNSQSPTPRPTPPPRKTHRYPPESNRGPDPSLSFTSPSRRAARAHFEMALGRRAVQISLVPHSRRRRVIRTKCYWSAEETNTYTAVDNLGGSSQTDRLPVAFLRSCRQVYLEALVILHQRNTYYFDVREFSPAVLGALGEYSFGDIHNVHLTHCTLLMWPRSSVFSLLARMGLRCLTVEFQEEEWMGILHLDTPDYSVSSPWCQNLLPLPKLQKFDVIFKDRFGAVDPADREAFKQQMRELIMGPAVAET
ncbi:hypothetical protein C8J57DRAFT_459340 [Mycena rebaudengoi]|nr:hypothetical protein C8J57DRAFT_459340 [Mycena rebaudengoi]